MHGTNNNYQKVGEKGSYQFWLNITEDFMKILVF